MFFPRRQFFRNLLAATVLALALPAFADSDFVAVKPAQPTDNPAKIEVLEFFSYGCPHCADFNGPLSAWAAKLPADVQFRRVPITFNRAPWANVARLYYAIEATGDLEKLDTKIFHAIHEQRVNLFDEKSIFEWIAKQGVDAKKFSDAYNGFSIQSKVKRGDQMLAAYANSLPRDVGERFGVPAVFVDGKFLVTARAPAEMLAVIDKAIAKARAERGKK